MEQKDGDNPVGEDEAGGSEKGRSIPVIKIRIPKKAAAAAEEDQEEEARSHYCKECNKSFNSGKALGGHMSSAHVQANNLKKQMSASNSKRKSPSSSSSATAAACGICARVFQSRKSLFGHMRCHPDRLWRGMEPPPEMKINSSEDDEDDILNDHELGFFNLKGWPTSKRGRAPVSSSSSASTPLVAGFQLMKMLKDDDGDAKKPAAAAAEEEKELYMTAIEVLMSAKREQRSSVNSNSNSDSEKYKCSVCGRVFSTHQALGGHRSSHNKFKMTIFNTNAFDSEASTSTANNAAAANGGGAFPFDLNVAPADDDDDDDENEDMVDSSHS
ncbi:zinc finger protein ZAT4-like [Salvia miltiorrhiza]|uniref:zinc finger protein ZAT4-like n=1 Tax=Salvia miltiorrhiza TaxID=226208 RepID=UPI0025AC0F29|nr:zinc finger protein ZAT4-like [Salvia miltiorrhiza]